MDKTFIFVVLGFIAVCSPVLGDMEAPVCPGQCHMPNNSCIDVGATVQDGCITYKCFKYQNKYTYRPSKIGCKVGEGCLQLGKKMDDNTNCRVLKCRRVPGTSNTIGIKIIPTGCKFQGDCKKRNTTWTTGCHQHKCRVFHRKGYAKIFTRFGCKVGDGCLPLGKVKEDKEHCRHLKCRRVPGNSSLIEVKSKPYGCKVGDGCLPLGKLKEDKEHCRHLKCRRVPGNSNLIEVKSKPYGCRYKGECKEKNEQWMTHCNQHKCHLFPRKGYGKIRTKYGCSDNNGNCHAKGAEWDEGCHKYQCKVFKKKGQNVIVSNSKLLKSGCMDADGSCHDISKGQVEKSDMWPYMMNGQRYEHCYCKKEGSMIRTLCHP